MVRTSKVERWSVIVPCNGGFLWRQTAAAMVDCSAGNRRRKVRRFEVFR